MAKIGIVSSSSAVNEKSVMFGADIFKSAGYDIVFAPHLFCQNRFLAGTDEERAADLTAFFADKTVDYILQAGGGYGSARLLDKLDYDFIKAHKKPVIGLSDTTALQCALIAKADLTCYSGFLLKKRFNDYEIPSSLSDLIAHSDVSFEINETGFAQGRLVGGCFSLVASLIGTPYLPDMTNAILVLEDLNEEPYAIDRMFQHLHLAGIFAKVSAVVFGNFWDCLAKDSADGLIDDVLAEWTDKIGKPVFTGLNYGHQPYSGVLPFGAKATISNGYLQISGKDY